MKQLNWYQIFGNVHKIPDGRTVTPTDDIQIWLNCADIWDKAYTTLAEVLADTDTLLALINSNNAVDYMVRSTTWASYTCVPTMTDNTHPSGTVFASGYYSSYYPWKAFDGNDSTEWEVAGNTNQYLGYRFTEAVSVWKCKVVNLGYSDNIPKDCWIEYSDDNSTWTKVSGSDFVNSGVAGATTEVTIAESGEHEYWRLYISNTQGGGNYVYVATLQFYTVAITASESAMQYIGASNYAANTLLADATWCEAICNSEYFESVLNVKVPTMTSATTPSGEVRASSEDTNNQFYRWKAYDNNANTFWATNTSQSGPNVSAYGWNEYNFGKKVYIAMVHIYTRDCVIRNLEVQVSDDGVSYTKVKDYTSSATAHTSNTFQKVILDTHNENNIWRLYYNAYHTGIGTWPNANTIQFYGREDV